MNKKITLDVFCLTYGHNLFRLSLANSNTPELVCKTCKDYFKFENDGSITKVQHKEKESYSALIYIKKTA